ncbi:hypothetical protein NWQ33_03935 [Mycoplasmopsis cynos]|nr:hypothetical protein [Mycoplasmopsis cynos]
MKKKNLRKYFSKYSSRNREDLNTPTTYNFNLPLVYKSTTLSSINTNTPNALQVNKENTNIIPLTELSNSILQAKQNLSFDPLGKMFQMMEIH